MSARSRGSRVCAIAASSSPVPCRAAEDVSILIVEQFAHEVLDVAQTAAIMLHGSIQLTGRPHQIAEELDAAYLGLAQPN